MKRCTALRMKLREAQDGRCCYCLVALTPPRKPEQKQLATSETIEHLRRKQDGGSNRRDNIALACYRCNVERGGVDWFTYTTYRRGELWDAA